MIPQGQLVPRREFEQLKEIVERLQQEIDALKNPEKRKYTKRVERVENGYWTTPGHSSS